MSVTNGERLVTKQDLADFYNDIRPYMGGIVTSKAGFTPIGTIISVMGTTAPANYLACDGTVYNIADYTELANYFNEQFGSKNFFGGDGTTTFAVPDLQGEFLRGTGTNSHANQGSGASVGVHQDATQIPTLAVDSDSSSTAFTYQNSNNIDIQNADSSIASTKRLKLQTVSEPFNDRNAVNTTRPTNTSVLYCIATKNFYIDPTLDYSTEEKIIGTWLNGEPLYQKTVEFTNISKGERTLNHGIANVDWIRSVNATIILDEPTHTMAILPYLSANSAYNIAVYNFTPTSFMINVGNSHGTIPKCIVTFQYTKTTD